MKVLHVQRSAGIGGSERHLLALLPALRARGVEVVACVARVERAGGNGDANRFVGALEAQGVETVVVPAGGDVAPGLVRALLREIRRHRPDVVHTHLIHADVHGQLAAACRRVPAVRSVHSMHAFYRRPPYRTAFALAGRLARRTIAISEAVRRFLLDGHLVPADRVRVVPYGVDTAAWTTTADERAQARRVWGIEAGQTAIGVASRLVPGKGHDLLLDALERVVTGEQSVRLVVAGDGPLRAELEASASRRLPPGTVRFLGFLDDVRVFMGACDAIVFPTRPALGEGFGLAALEAMAAGRPVVATSVGPLGELVADGETGLLVTPDEPDELAGALLELAGDPERCALLGAKGRDRAGTCFGLDVMAGATLRVYEEVA